jgi:hypothetical protein
MPGTFRACSNACLSASPESIACRKTCDVEGLGPSQDGLGTGSILMKNSGLSTMQIHAECDASFVPLLRDACEALAQGEHC